MDLSEWLPRLRRLRLSGEDSWTACCPAHEDRSPSLAVKRLRDGRVLLHCFAGCGTDAVLDALGLTFADVMPKGLGDFSRSAFSPIEALRALTRESSVVAIAAADIAAGKKLSEADASRICIAAGRIATALEAIHGG